jgi:putative protease
VFAIAKEVGMPEKEIGKITHYYGNISVGIIELSDNLKVGESIHIKGYTSDFTQNIDSMQIEHATVSEAGLGDAIGVKVSQKVHPGDKVFKVIA